MKNGIPDNLNNGIGIDPENVDTMPSEPEPQPQLAPNPEPQSNPQPEAVPNSETQTEELKAEQAVEPVQKTIEEKSEATPQKSEPNPNAIPDLPVSDVPQAEESAEPQAQPIPGSAPAAPNPTVANSNGFVEANKVENIGTQPPKNDKEPKPINKILFIILIIVLMAGVAYGVYYYLRLGNNVKVTLKSVESTVNEPLSTNVADYAKIKGTASKNCSVITTSVDNTKIGKYTYTIKCGNKSYEGKIAIVDVKDTGNENSDLAVEMKDVRATIGDSITEANFIISDTCNKNNCNFTFANKTGLENNLQTAGTYDVVIEATADNTEKTELHANLIVLSPNFKVFASCTKKDNNLEITDRIAFSSVNEFNDTAYRVYKYTFASDEDYNSVAGSKPTKITYNNITGNAKYNDADKTISIFTNLDKNTLTQEYGSEFPTMYNEVTTYYQNNGYECTIEQ